MSKWSRVEGCRVGMAVSDALWAGVVLPFIDPYELARGLARTSQWGRAVVRRAVPHHRQLAIRSTRGSCWRVPPPELCAAFRLQELSMRDSYPSSPIPTDGLCAAVHALLSASSDRLQRLVLWNAPRDLVDRLPTWPKLPALTTLQLVHVEDGHGERALRKQTAGVQRWLQINAPALEDLTCATGKWWSAFGVLPHLRGLRRLRFEAYDTTVATSLRRLIRDLPHSVERLVFQGRMGRHDGDEDNTPSADSVNELLKRPAMRVLELRNRFRVHFRLDRRDPNDVRVWHIVDGDGFRIQDVHAAAHATRVHVIFGDYASAEAANETERWLSRVQATHLAICPDRFDVLPAMALARVSHLHIVACLDDHRMHPDDVSRRIADMSALVQLDADVDTLDRVREDDLHRLITAVRRIGLYATPYRSDETTLARKLCAADPERLRCVLDLPWFRE